MKKISIKNRWIKALTSVFCLSFLLNCSKTETELTPKFDDNSFEISLEQAIATAKSSPLIKTRGNTSAKVGYKTELNAQQEKEVDKTVSISDDKGRILFHVINYKNNKGWTIIAGDERIIPVLAYSDNGTFNVSQIPGGASHWFNFTKLEAKKIKDSNQKVHPIIKRMWLNQNSGTGVIGNQVLPPSGPPVCPPDPPSYDLDDFLRDPSGNRIEFSQSAGYNSQIPTPIIMTGSCACNRPPAGCGPVAVAQIMTYFGKKGVNKPSNFNFNVMPNSLGSWSCNVETSGQLELAALISKIYRDCNSSYVPFACNSVTGPGQLGNAFNSAGYTNTGGWVGGDVYAGAGDLATGTPVMYWGSKGSIDLKDAHIWVSSGIHRFSYYSQQPNGGCDLYVSDQRYMNWGWNGAYNAWYHVYNLNPDGSGAFTSWLDVWRNIQP